MPDIKKTECEKPKINNKEKGMLLQEIAFSRYLNDEQHLLK